MLIKTFSAPLRNCKYGLFLPAALLFALFFRPAPALAQSSDVLSLADVETPPAFPGGQKTLMAFLGNNIAYPDAARKSKAEGVVALEFVVGKDGSVSDITHLNTNANLHPALVAEAIRVVKLMPGWTPAMKNGKAVSVKFTLPIKFKLE